MKRFKTTFPRTAVNILSRGACKAKKSVIIDPYTCLPDSNNYRSLHMFSELNLSSKRLRSTQNEEIAMCIKKEFPKLLRLRNSLC